MTQKLWRAGVRYALTSEADDDRLGEALESVPGFGILQIRDGQVKVDMTVEAGDVTTALAVTVRAAEGALGGLVTGEPLGVWVLDDDTHLADMKTSLPSMWSAVTEPDAGSST